MSSIGEGEGTGVFRSRLPGLFPLGPGNRGWDEQEEPHRIIQRQAPPVQAAAPLHCKPLQLAAKNDTRIMPPQRPAYGFVGATETKNVRPFGLESGNVRVNTTTRPTQ